MSNEPSGRAFGALESSSRLRATLFRRACRQLDPAGDLELALLMMPEAIATNELGADPKLAAAVARRVQQDWDPSSRAVQIQYVHFDDLDDPLVLYTKPVGDSLIVLVACSNVLLGRLRRIAVSLVNVLSESNEPPAGGNTLTVDSLLGAGEKSESAYAIAWRPVEPLPKVIRDIIRVSAQQLARRMGCQLNFIGVASDHVHLVLHCPPRRQGSWAAYVFKHGIEEDISSRFGTHAMLWQKGFLADSSGQPIGGEALMAYLSD